MSGAKSSVFWWSDWESDDELKLCSLAAQGLWMRMLCICAKADPRGYLVIAGRPLSPTDLSRIVGRPEPEVRTLIDELAAYGVFSTDRKGQIYSRRILRDEKRAKDGSKGAQKRWAQEAEKKREKSLPNGQTHGPPIRGPTTPYPYPLPESNDRKLAEAQGPPLDGLIERLIAAANGNVVHGAYGIEVLQPILDLQSQGCDLEADILPATAEMVPKLEKPLRTWGARFLRDAILARQAARLRGRGTNGHGFASPEPDEVRWHRMWKAWERGTWPYIWGPDPKSAGCEIPKGLIEKWSEPQ